MSNTLMRRALRRSVAQIRHVRPVPSGTATGLVAAVYAQVERDFGMLAPPVVLHSPAAGPLAASWAMLRETLLARGVADRAAKEVVAAAVSLGNACSYCVDVHSAVIGGLAHRGEADAISGDRVDAMTDPALRDLAAWARSSGQRESILRRDLPFPLEQLPEFGGVVVTFQYLNRMVTVFCEDSPLPAALPAPLAAGMMRVLGRFLRSTARGALEPGASLDLLPKAPAPDDLAWAADRQVIADAFARAISVIEAAGVRAVGDRVRDLVTNELAGWSGQPVGLGRSWADDALTGLTQVDRPAARLALLTAFAPHQVGQRDIEEFRRGQRSDEDLIGLAAWASLAAARRVGCWLTPPQPTRGG
jgi:AhpD family alkylhydroperoxidase